MSFAKFKQYVSLFHVRSPPIAKRFLENQVPHWTWVSKFQDADFLNSFANLTTNENVSKIMLKCKNNSTLLDFKKKKKKIKTGTPERVEREQERYHYSDTT